MLTPLQVKVNSSNIDIVNSTMVVQVVLNWKCKSQMFEMDKTFISHKSSGLHYTGTFRYVISKEIHLQIKQYEINHEVRHVWFSGHIC